MNSVWPGAANEKLYESLSWYFNADSALFTPFTVSDNVYTPESLSVSIKPPPESVPFAGLSREISIVTSSGPASLMSSDTVIEEKGNDSDKLETLTIAGTEEGCRLRSGTPLMTGEPSTERTTTLISETCATPSSPSAT